jgi:hypothetical protein
MQYSTPANELLGLKKEKKSLNRVKKEVFIKWVDIGIEKIRKFTLISKLGPLPL